MCRLAAFPPKFPRNKALEVIKEMAGNNLDGVGSCYVRPDGKFVICRHPGSIHSLLSSEHGKEFLAHMPYNGWTIIHLRFGTHGANTYENTHPFVVGEWAVVHNGVWCGYRESKNEYGDAMKLKGQTDSEVAANILSMKGPRKFMKEVSFGGVFLGLNRNGSLWVCKTSGQLNRYKLGDSEVLSSEFNQSIKHEFVDDGTYRYNKLGKITLSSKKAVPKYEWGGYYGREGFSPSPKAVRRFGANVYEFPPQDHKDGVIVPRDPGVIDDTEDPDMMSEDRWRIAYGADSTAQTYEERGYPRSPVAITQTRLF